MSAAAGGSSLDVPADDVREADVREDDVREDDVGMDDVGMDDVREDDVRGPHLWSPATVMGSLGRLARQDASALERQIPFTALNCFGLLFVPLGFLPLYDPPLLYWSIALVILQLALAAVLPWPRWPESAVMVMPVL